MEYCRKKKKNTMHLLLYMLIKSQMNQLKKTSINKCTLIVSCRAGWTPRTHTRQ